MSTIVLLRHARSTANGDGVLAGRASGVTLDETGAEQAGLAAERLAGIDFAAVVSSPLERCQQTAAAVTAMPLHLDERFTECDYGEWSGRPLTELASEPLWAAIQAKPSEVHFPNGERMADMRERVVAGVADWDARLGEDATWLLVSHGDLIKTVLSHALGQDFDDFQRILIDPASISVVRWAQPRPHVVTMNSHAGLVAPLLGASGGGPQLGGEQGPA